MRPLLAALLAMMLLLLVMIAWDILDGDPPVAGPSAGSALTGSVAGNRCDTHAWPALAGDPVGSDPRQENRRDLPSFDFRGYQLQPRAQFQVAARVLGSKSYSSGREAGLSSRDLALGWGPMADDAVLANIEISQSNRFFFWKTPQYPIPRRDIEVHAANMHAIPASAEVAAGLDDLDEDDRVELRGCLVDARADDGWYWHTSLTREDTGKGACELFYIEQVRRLP